MTTIAAIDIGSNALRSSIAVVKRQKLHIVHQLREPLRIGEEVFRVGKISEDKLKYAEITFVKLLRLFDRFGVEEVKICATSALRDAKNSSSLVQRIKNISGLNVQIISGLQEAKLIQQAVSSAIALSHREALLIDIGGGSTEITIVKNNLVMATRSFNIGTLRLLQEKNMRKMESLIEDETFQIENYLRKKINIHEIEFAIGTGGNLRRMGKLRKKILRKDSDKFASYKDIEKIYNVLAKHTFEERIRLYQMRRDRADVIIPATYIIKSILARLHTPKILLPDVGLKEGILLSMVD